MNRFDLFMNFFNGNPSEELLWYLDFNLNWITNRPSHINSWDDLAYDLGCIWPAICMSGYKEEFDANIEYRQYTNDNEIINEWHTPIGDLRSRIKQNHPIEYPVKTSAECRVLKYIYEHTRTCKNETSAGKFHCISLPPSPVQQLLQYDMGLETFYTLPMTDAEVIEELMNVMQQKQMERTFIASQFDIPIVYQGENTSTTMISPSFYQKYSLMQIKQQCDFLHSKNKKFMLHMCGLLNNLLPLIKETGIDGIHSVTPPPIGDTKFERVYTVFGNRFPIQGRFGSTQWFGLNDDDIIKNLSVIVEPKLWQKVPFVLLVTLDGVVVDYTELKHLAEIIKAY